MGMSDDFERGRECEAVGRAGVVMGRGWGLRSGRGRVEAAGRVGLRVNTALTKFVKVLPSN